MTSPKVPKLSVRSIADLIAAVPYLLGFHPTQSIVVVALRGKQLVFAARVDLPPADATPDTRQAAATHLGAVVAKQNVEAVTVIGYGPADHVTPAVDATAAALRRAGLEVMDVLRVTDGRYWSYLCDNAECCPPQGIPFNPESSHIAAAAIFAGQVALPDREALQRQVAAVDGAERAAMHQATDRAEERLAALLRDADPTDPLGGRALQQAGEAEVRQAMDRYRNGERLSDDEVAWLSLLLLHIPVRDHAWELIESVDWQVSLWTDLVRRVQPELVAAPASLLAFAAWRLGQGALASVALERARQAVPDYSLALLLEEVLQNGIPPATLDTWPDAGLVEPGPRRPRRSRRQPRRRSRRRPPHTTRSAPL